MRCSIDQRPQDAGGFRVLFVAAKQARTNSEQHPPAQAQALPDPLAPGKRIEQRQPGVFELRQFASREAARNDLRLYGLKSRLGGWKRLVQLVEPLPPPGHANRTERRLRTAGHDVGECEVEVPQCLKSGPDLGRRRLERRATIGVEPPISDSRPSSLPRRRRTL